MLVSALVAGILAGLAVTLVQMFTTSELILQAEGREQGTSEAHHEHPASSTQPHDHWTPGAGTERSLYTALATVLMGVGYGLLLAAVLTGLRWTGWRHGLLAGLGGFLVFQLAPALGLPPQLPGAPEADLLHRQLWWLATVVSTALGLFALLRVRHRGGRWWLLVSVALLCAPHLVGAPAPSETQSAAALADARVFSLMALATGALFWALLGLVGGSMLNRLAQTP